MKTFIYSTKFKNSKYGSNVILRVYRIKNNLPIFLGEAFYNTGSYRGHEHEALDLIIQKKELPKNCQKGKYVNYNKLDKVYKLISI